MAHRVDTAVQAVQPAAGQAMVDRVFPEPEPDQLRARDYTLLPLHQARHSRIDSSGRSSPLATPSQPAYDAG